MSPLQLLLRNFCKMQMTIPNLCRNSGKTYSIDQRWLLFATKPIESESAANNATRPQWQCSPRVLGARNNFVHWKIHLCTENIFVHWKIYLCTEKHICALKFIYALKNTFVHWKICLCTEKHIRTLKIIFVHWETCSCIRKWNCELNKFN